MPPKKVFVDDEPKVEMVVEEPKAKPKRKRKPLTAEQKKSTCRKIGLGKTSKEKCSCWN